MCAVPALRWCSLAPSIQRRSRADFPQIYYIEEAHFFPMNKSGPVRRFGGLKKNPTINASTALCAGPAKWASMLLDTPKRHHIWYTTRKIPGLVCASEAVPHVLRGVEPWIHLECKHPGAAATPCPKAVHSACPRDPYPNAVHAACPRDP